VELLLTTLLVVAALAIAGSGVYGMLVRDEGGRSTPPPAVAYVADWESGLSISRRIFGVDNAPTTILALVDLECGACAQFNRTLKEVLPEFGDSVRVLYVHYPLRQHRFATPAANAAECAYSQAGTDGFQRWVDLVYGKSDSLGLKSWGAFAFEAELPDSVAIQACALRSEVDERVRDGLLFGQRIGFLGLPMYFVDGWRLVGSPSPGELRRVVQAVRLGRTPS
jgi:protein-disulfide isomerase